MLISEAQLYFDSYLVGEDKALKTRTNYRTALVGRNGLTQSIGDVDIAEIGLHSVNKWKVDMRMAGLMPNTRNVNLIAFRIFLRWLSENEFSVMDWPKVTLDKDVHAKPHTILSPEEVAKLMANTNNQRDRAIISLFFGTGCRSAEILELDRDQWEAAELVDMANGVWEITVLGKNKKYRPVCFFQEVKDEVDRYLDTRRDKFKPLFISNQNRRIHWTTVGKMLHEVTRKAGLSKRVTQHVFRHSFATEMGANGMPLPVLAYSLGHSNAIITQKVYTHINAGHSRKAYASFHPGARLAVQANQVQ